MKASSKKWIAAQAGAVLLALLTACQSGGASSAASSRAADTSSAVSSEAPISSEAPASSEAPVSSQAPVSSKPPAAPSKAPAAPSAAPTPSKAPAAPSAAPATPTAGTITLAEETRPSGHYNNTVAPFNSAYVTVCGDYALEIVGGSASKSYAAAVTAFAAKYPNLKVAAAIIPKSAAFNHPDKYANQFNVQKNIIANTYALMSGAVTVDVFGELAKHQGEYTYYRTDHHWNSLGAYYASVAYCHAMGIAPRALDSYQTVCTSGYIGSLYTFCAKPKPECLRANPDFTVGRLPAASYTMTYTSGGKTYNGTAINAKSSGYMMFMCGDQAFTHIKTGNSTGRKLLMFKESYGNAFAPYMIDYYDEIVVIDIRQETKATSAIIAEYGITDVLVINNIQAACNAAQIKQLTAKLTA